MAVYKQRGKWMYDFEKNGQRYREGGFETKSEAQDEEAKARTTAKRINTDFIRLCESRLEEIEMRRSKGHFERNKLLIENLIKRWATKKAVTREDVEDLLNEVARESKYKANRYLALIKALYNHGIERQWFEYNPTKGIKPFGIERARKYIPPIEDIRAVLSQAKEMERKYLLALLYTMARMREINRLRWEDVTEDCVILRTRKAKNSDVAERKIPLTPTLKAILEGLPRVGEYVFTNPATKTRYDNRINLIRSLCRKAGVKPFTFHNLRHWGASKLAKENVPLTDIQRLLGHTRPTTTDTYLQSLNPSLSSAINKLEDPPPNPPPSDSN
jgi:integrase